MALVMITTFHKSPKKLAIVISNNPIPIFCCGINWQGPSCKNLAMASDDDSIEIATFNWKIDGSAGDPVWELSSMTFECIRITNTNNWGKVSANASEKMKENEWDCVN